jgi:hypothetical protein
VTWLRFLAAPVVALVLLAASCNPPPPDPNGWIDLAQCETGGQWSQSHWDATQHAVEYGGLNLTDTLWRNGGGPPGHANQYDQATQITVAGRLLQAAGGGRSIWSYCWPNLWPNAA